MYKKKNNKELESKVNHLFNTIDLELSRIDIMFSNAIYDNELKNIINGLTKAIKELKKN